MSSISKLGPRALKKRGKHQRKTKGRHTPQAMRQQRARHKSQRNKLKHKR